MSRSYLKHYYIKFQGTRSKFKKQISKIQFSFVLSFNINYNLKYHLTLEISKNCFSLSIMQRGT